MLKPFRHKRGLPPGPETNRGSYPRFPGGNHDHDTEPDPEGAANFCTGLPVVRRENSTAGLPLHRDARVPPGSPAVGPAVAGHAGRRGPRRRLARATELGRVGGDQRGRRGLERGQGRGTGDVVERFHRRTRALVGWGLNAARSRGFTGSRTRRPSPAPRPSAAPSPPRSKAKPHQRSARGRWGAVRPGGGRRGQGRGRPSAGGPRGG